MADCFLLKTGQVQNIEYGENIFDFANFKSTLSTLSQPVVGGTIEWLDDGFTLKATVEDCYTYWQYGYAPTVAVGSNTVYELSFDVNGDYGNNFIFFEYPPSTDQMISRSNQNNKIIFHTLANTEKITIRFGVQASGTTVTYTNIQIRKIVNI